MRASIRSATLPLAAVALAAGGRAASAQRPAAIDSVFLVAAYDTARDPFADLRMAMERASADGKRILIDVGGDWCSWCHILDDYIAAHPRVIDAIRRSYVAVKVNMSSGHENERFLSQYPTIPGYPHLFVLGADGSLIHSQNTSELEEGHSYNQERVLAFLTRWVPPPGPGDTHP